LVSLQQAEATAARTPIRPHNRLEEAAVAQPGLLPVALLALLARQETQVATAL
tara:strand:+ start:335 stop:493 length:159 start_codon:yes stop_codon:yes gene_type:complete